MKQYFVIKADMSYVGIYDDDKTWEHFHVTGPLWGESTGHQWIPLTKHQ